MNDDIPQPGDRQPSDDDLYAAYKRRKYKRLLIGFAICSFLVGLGYGAYYAFFRLDHLISQVKDCDISEHSGVEASCEKAMRALVRELPEACPRVLAWIRNEPDLTRKNRLLYALLKARIARHGTKKLTLAAVRPNR